MENNKQLNQDSDKNEELLGQENISDNTQEHQEEELSPENKAMKESLEEMENLQDFEKKIKEFEQTLKETKTFKKIDKDTDEVLEEHNNHYSDYEMLKDKMSKAGKELLRHKGELYAGAGVLAFSVLFAAMPDIMEQFQDKDIPDGFKNFFRIGGGMLGTAGIYMGFKGAVEAIKNKTMRNKALKRVLGLGASGVPLDKASQVAKQEMSKQSHLRRSAEDDVTAILASEDGYVNSAYGGGLRVGVQREQSAMTKGSETEYTKEYMGELPYISKSTREYELDAGLLNQVRAKLSELGVEGPNQDIVK